MNRHLMRLGIGDDTGLDVEWPNRRLSTELSEINMVNDR